MSKGHAEELVPAGERFDFVIAVISFDAFLKFVFGKKVDQLRENGFSEIHMPSSGEKVQEYGILRIPNSNRKMPFSLIIHLFSGP